MGREVCLAMGVWSMVTLGCGGAAAPGGTTPIAPEVLEDRARLAELNERAREGAVVEELHGVRVEDPFRALERDGPETRAWIDAQTERTERRLAPHAGPALRERLTELMSIGVLARPRLAGGAVLYLRREADQEQSVLVARAGPGGEARVLLDPAAEGERVSIDWFFPSPGGRHVAVGLSERGDERSVLRVLEVATGAEVGRRIERCKWSTVAWLHDEQGFYYTRYPREGEDGFREDEQDAYFPRVFFHRLGADPADDPLVYGADEPDDFPSPSVSDDDRWLVLEVMRGWSRSDLYLVDRRDPERGRITVSEGCDCLVSGVLGAGRLWLLSNEGHPRYRVLAVEPERAGDREAWVEVVPESEAAIEGLVVTASRLVVHDIHELASRLRLVGHDGSPAGELPLPSAGTVAGLSARPGTDEVVLGFSSFFHPPAILAADLAEDGPPRLVETVRTELDLDRFVVRRETVSSADGTQVNLFLVHDRDARADGRNRVLLYGYGGFNISLLPSFTRRALHWIERGGTYAVANLRGGSEHGEAWHRAGMLENKERVFEDFEAALRWLSSSGWSAPERIAILGGSNGGLLVGATLTRCPDAFGAAIGLVGLYDMLRYDRFPPAELWVSEYGTASDPAQLPFLRAYSPYHNVRDGVAYPPTLIETADHDTRVHWAHSTKFTARLQEASTAPERVLFHMERQVGHGAGTGRTELIEQTVRIYAFLAASVGLGEEPPEPVRAQP